jgi:hypothetical protein
MSQEHDKTSPEAAASEGIHTEASPFELGYQPDTLPKISVPDLADDAQGLTAEALEQIPTLTEEAPGKDLLDTVPDQPVGTEVPQTHAVEEAVVAPAQDMPVQADTWTEALHVRMGKLTDDIHTLNTRLDRLEERNKTKV